MRRAARRRENPKSTPQELFQTFSSDDVDGAAYWLTSGQTKVHMAGVLRGKKEACSLFSLSLHLLSTHEPVVDTRANFFR